MKKLPSVKDRSLHPDTILDSTGSRDWKSGKESFKCLFVVYPISWGIEGFLTKCFPFNEKKMK